MNLLESLLNAQGGDAVRQLAGRFGIDESQAASAVSALLPALTGGVQRNVAQEGGLDSLLGALGGGDHQKYLDDPGALSDGNTLAEGNGILGHILGSKEVSKQVAAQAADQTGVDHSVLKQMLPLVATMMMGALSKHTGQAQDTSQDNIAGMLGGLLESGQGGSGGIAGNVLDMASKLFR
jgi:hypothetical protein